MKGIDRDNMSILTSYVALSLFGIVLVVCFCVNSTVLNHPLKRIIHQATCMYLHIAAGPNLNIQNSY
jgi:hypothetical protein